MGNQESSEEAHKEERKDDAEALPAEGEAFWDRLVAGMAGDTSADQGEDRSGWIVAVGGDSEKQVANEKDDGTIVAGLFSTRKPKDMGAGLSSGLKSVGKGVAVGAASLLVCPMVGAKEEGVGGFFKGMGAGVLAAVALPIAGLSVAGYQVSRGLMNTPEAVNEKTKGKKWDRKNREWKVNWYSLEDEFEQVKSDPSPTDKQHNEEQPSPQKHTQNNSKKVAETEYYDLLQVATDATQAQIRKNYYKLAREWHPDKNSDPGAGEKFQKIGEAYQVLGDEERRAEYDKHGRSVASEMPIIDASLFFMMLFGSEKLEPYMGKLKMAMFVELMDTKEPNKSSQSGEELEKEQTKREVILAVALSERLKPFVLGSIEAEASGTLASENEHIIAWKIAIDDEAKDICNSSFGEAIVAAIGWVYENYSSQYLGKLDTFWGLGGRYAKMQAKSRYMGNSWKTASSALRTALAARKIQQREERKVQQAARKKRVEERKKNRKLKKESKKGDNDKKEDQKNNDEKNHDEKNNDDQNDTEAENDGPNSDFDSKAAHDAAKDLEETLPLILETMLNICLIDIESTVRSASKKVLKDMSVDLQTRRMRAEGLVILGQTLQTAAEAHRKLHAHEPQDARKNIEEAFIRAAQKADDDEVKQ